MKADGVACSLTGETSSYHKITQEADDTYSTDYGWGLFREEDDSGGGLKGSRYCRTYAWNERNQLISSVDSNYNTAYVYGQDGQRSNKYTANSETLYFNKMWTLHTDSGNNVYGGQSAKNIYLGETRIVTKLNSGTNPTYQEEYYKQYFYHSDHLGSASLISDYKGDEYQRIEYTPYGETWVEKTGNTGLEYLPYRFTGKEIDEETGLYYYGARYLDPKYSMWISTDPALGEYIPKAPIDEEAKKYNQNLPGMGGVFNHINGNLFAYAANNPVKYTDPDGKFADIAWDLISLGLGVKSFVDNIKKGDVTGAIIDGAGIIADTAAAALPFIPGGAGTAIKAVRATKATVEIIGGTASGISGTKNIIQGVNSGDNAQVLTGIGQIVSGGGQLTSGIKTLSNMKNASKFFEGAYYSDKVNYQMSKGSGENHSFPDDVTMFSGDGIIKNIKGGDGNMYQKLIIPGEYNGKKGNFEFIKDETGKINHRFFNPE